MRTQITSQSPHLLLPLESRVADPTVLPPHAGAEVRRLLRSTTSCTHLAYNSVTQTRGESPTQCCQYYEITHSQKLYASS